MFSDELQDQGDAGRQAQILRFGAEAVFRELRACDQQEFTEVSLMELAAFVVWSRAQHFSSQVVCVSEWDRLSDDVKSCWVPDAYRTILASEPAWRHVLVNSMSP